MYLYSSVNDTCTSIQYKNQSNKTCLCICICISLHQIKVTLVLMSITVLVHVQLKRKIQLMLLLSVEGAFCTNLSFRILFYDEGNQFLPNKQNGFMWKIDVGVQSISIIQSIISNNNSNLSKSEVDKYDYLKKWIITIKTFEKDKCCQNICRFFE